MTRSGEPEPLLAARHRFVLKRFLVGEQSSLGSRWREGWLCFQFPRLVPVHFATSLPNQQSPEASRARRRASLRREDDAPPIFSPGEAGNRL